MEFHFQEIDALIINNHAIDIIDATHLGHAFSDLAPLTMFHNGQDPSRSSTEQEKQMPRADKVVAPQIQKWIR